MPTVMHLGPYRLFFYANDRAEPVHVHVEREASNAKFWLGPVRLARNNGFRPIELGRIERLVSDHEDGIAEAWHDYFGD
ncbi:MAG: DUF4160 domain-containing protein [Deltaproteobacteria bacterium]|nr:DUF4160 domain-containing protein [Deltaproteobacteria bacterium]